MANSHRRRDETEVSRRRRCELSMDDWLLVLMPMSVCRY